MLSVKNMFYLMTTPVTTALLCWLVWIYLV
jgi:hypothetical protein